MDKDDELNLDLGKVWPFGKKKKDTSEKKENENASEEETTEPVEASEEKPHKAEHKAHGTHKKHEQKSDDDEISLDFGKLFGKGKKEAKVPQEKPKHEAKQEDEDHIDLGSVGHKIRSALKSHDKEKKEDEISVDLGGLSSFFSNKKNLILPILAIIAIVFVSSYIRMLPSQMIYTDDWARQSVYGMLTSDLNTVIRSQYPNLPDQNVGQLVNDELNKAIKQDSYTFQSGQFAGQQMQVSSQVKQTSDYFKSFFQDSNGNMYMPDIDPYYWLRYAKNIVTHGHPGDTIKDGRSFDNHQLAPVGRFIEPEDTLYPYSLAILFNFLRTFNPSITLMQAEMISPVIIAALSGVLVFLLARRIGGDVAGFFAGMMFAINPSFLTRSLYGHGDSDTFIVFFSVLISFLFLSALESRKWKWQIGLAAGAGLAIGLYSRFWGGWWYIFDFLLAASAIYGSYLILLKFSILKKDSIAFLNDAEVKSLWMTGIIFVFASGFFVLFISGAAYLTQPIEGLGFTRIKEPVMASLWPNVLTTVAELNEGDINGIIGNVGGLFLFYIGLLGIMLSMAKKKVDTRELMFITGAALWWLALLLARNSFTQSGFLVALTIPIFARIIYAGIKKEQIHMSTAALLILWFIITIYASTKGIRFVLLLAPAFSIAFGVTIGFMYRHGHNLLSRDIKVNKTIASITLIVLGIILFIFPTNVFGQAQSIGRYDTPMINDAWYNSLTAIRDNTNKSAIITSWWDFGHHFKALAERPVTFDGTTQGSPQAHWVGQILRTDNEKMAIGILRMLDCGGNQAFDEVQKTNKEDTVTSVKTLYDIFERSRADAKKTLISKYKMTDLQAENVLKLTHCNPPEGIFIASEDMIGKAGVWAHFGSWNFERAYAWHMLRGMPIEQAVLDMQNKFGYSKEQAEQVYYDMMAIANDPEANTWVAPWPSYAQTDSCNSNGECNNGMRINLTTFDVSFPTQNGIRHPKFAAYLTKTDVAKKTYPSDLVGIDLSTTVIPEGDGYKLLVTSPELNASMFTKMFFMGGHSLRHFKLLSHQRSITGAEIFVYKVDWNGSDPIIKSELIVKDIIKKGDAVKFSYIGYLENGEVFDSSIQNWRAINTTKNSKFDQKTTPFTFTVGNGDIIAGLEEQMIGMKKGTEKTIKVSPEKGYGLDPTQHPLANKTLIFKVRVEDIK